MADMFEKQFKVLKRNSKLPLSEKSKAGVRVPPPFHIKLANLDLPHPPKATRCPLKSTHPTMRPGCKVYKQNIMNVVIRLIRGTCYY